MKNIPRVVRRLIKRYGTKNPYNLCKYLGIVIIYKDLGETKGFFKKILKKKVIFLNEKLDEFSAKVVLAHELGHAILHSSTDFQFLCSYSLLPKTSIWENEANKFAAELLIEDDLELNLNNETYFDVDDKIVSELLDLKFNKNWRNKNWQ